jgi:hypothetical protein
MRVRILKPSEGVVDGVSLRCLVPGCLYDLSPPLARYLVTNGLAAETSELNAALVVPLDEPDALEQLTKGLMVLTPGEIVSLEKRHGSPDRRRITRSERRGKQSG